jgi:hypothetical protein
VLREEGDGNRSQLCVLTIALRIDPLEPLLEPVAKHRGLRCASPGTVSKPAASSESAYSELAPLTR